MKKIILAAAIAALASLAVASFASADVARYQTQSMTITAVQPEGAVGQWNNVWTHTYKVTLNPCDGSFSGTGLVGGTLHGPLGSETITGHLVGNAVSFTATRFDGFVYSLSNAPLDNSTVTLATSTPVAPWALEFKVGATMGATSSYKNHGQYVKDQGGGDDAAHSCIGMPITDAPFQWSAQGSIDSASPIGSTITLPVGGKYRITMSGTYVNGDKNVADAEYTSTNNWANQMNGYDIAPYLLGEGFGDVQVNGGFVDWGTYNVNHAYSLTTALTGTSVNLGVFDGDSNTNTKNASWYGDNSGSLNYTITYVGP